MDPEASNCTREELDRVLESHFALEFAVQRHEQRRRLVNGKVSLPPLQDKTWQTAAEVKSDLEAVCAGRQNCGGPWAGYLYDGLWTLALAMRATLDETGGEVQHSVLISALNNSTFQGVTVSLLCFVRSMR